MTKLFAAILAAFSFPVPAQAQPACAPVDTIIESLLLQHGEVPQAEMRDAGGHRLILLANPQTGSWSLFVLPRSNETVACVVATGGEFGAAVRQPGRTS
jgi:hypothetical protein